MRTYQHHYDVKYVAHAKTAAAASGARAQLTYEAGRKTAELWFRPGAKPWLLDTELLYRFAYHNAHSYNDPGLRWEQPVDSSALYLRDDDYTVELSLEVLRSFLSVIFQEPALVLSYPITGLLTLAGDDTEHQIQGCLQFTSYVALEATLDLGPEYGHHDCDRLSLQAGITNQIADDQLMIGPAQYQYLPVEFYTEAGQLDYIVKLEVSEVEDFLAQVERLVPTGQEPRYHPDQLDEELARWLISDEPPS